MKNILIVVDMQKGFAQCEQTMQLSKNIIQLLNKNLFDVVISTRFLNSQNSIYEKLFNWTKLESKEDCALPIEIEQHSHYIVDKYIYNCVDTSFIQRLCQLNDGFYPEKIFLAGVDTDCCILSIATSLFENNIRPIVLTKYCNSNGGNTSHEAGILCLQRLIGKKQISDIDPVTSKDLDEL